MNYNISKADINLLPLKSFEGKITIVSSDKDAVRALKYLEKESYIGFDSESKPAFKKGEINPIALIQLAGKNEVFIFRILETGVFPQLKKILEDSDIMKISQSADFELKKLKREKDIDCRNFIDLEKIAKKINSSQHSLRGLVAIFLNFRISKTSQQSNWERKILTAKQILYAATDAWVTREVFEEMNHANLIKNLNQFQIR